MSTSVAIADWIKRIADDERKRDTVRVREGEMAARKADLVRRNGPVLRDSDFKCDSPDGAYYVMADISEFGFPNDIEFTKHLIREIGVAVVPGSSFYENRSMGSQMVRFCFCKKDETLEAAVENLQKLKR